MADKPVRTVGPVALTTTLTTNVYNNTSALIKDILTHIHVVNKTDSPASFSLWVGATGANAAGTELFSKQQVAPRSCYDWYGRLVMASTDFLVGGSDTATALTLTAEGVQIVA